MHNKKEIAKKIQLDDFSHRSSVYTRYFNCSLEKFFLSHFEQKKSNANEIVVYTCRRNTCTQHVQNYCRIFVVHSFFSALEQTKIFQNRLF